MESYTVMDTLPLYTLGGSKREMHFNDDGRESVIILYDDTK